MRKIKRNLCPKFLQLFFYVHRVISYKLPIIDISVRKKAKYGKIYYILNEKRNATVYWQIGRLYFAIFLKNFGRFVLVFPVTFVSSHADRPDWNGFMLNNNKNYNLFQFQQLLWYLHSSWKSALLNSLDCIWKLK